MSAKQRNNPFPVMRPTLLPMWPRYFFVRFSLFDGQWRDLFDLARIRGLICDDVGGKPLPAPIDEAVIAGIVSLEVDGAVPSMATVKQIAYEIGEQVRIRTGTFAGHNGVVDGLPDTPLEALDESARLRLLVGMFGAMTPVELSIGDIEKL
jgi:transcription antitermination factor NusG